MNRAYTYRHTTFACYRGYITQAIINNLAPLLFIIFRTSFGITYEQLGALVLANFITQIVTDLWATKYADRFGYRKCMVVAHGLSFCGLLLLGILPLLLPDPNLGILLSIIVYAIGGGLLEVVVSPIIEALPNENKEGSMSLLHSFYCWGQMSVVILTTLLIWILGRDLWFVLPILWSLFPLYNMFSFLHVPILPLVTEGKGMKLKELFSTRTFYLAMILMICSGASELTMSQWSSMFAERGLGIPKVYGDLLGPGLFALFMAIGRTIFGYLGDRLPLKRVLAVSSVLCVITYLVTVFSTSPVLSLLACSLTGLTVSLMWPGTFSIFSATFPRGGTLMFGILAVCGDIGCSVGPWMAGKISDAVEQGSLMLPLWEGRGFNLEQIGLRSGLLAAILFPLLMFLGLALSKRRRE